MSIYRRTPRLKSRPKPQRAIIADILIEAGKDGADFHIIREKALDAGYLKTLKTASLEDSILWHLDKMQRDGLVTKD